MLDGGNPCDGEVDLRSRPSGAPCDCGCSVMSGDYGDYDARSLLSADASGASAPSSGGCCEPPNRACGLLCGGDGCGACRRKDRCFVMCCACCDGGGERRSLCHDRGRARCGCSSSWRSTCRSLCSSSRPCLSRFGDHGDGECNPAMLICTAFVSVDL